MKYLHRATYDVCRGKVKVYCSCGAQSPKLETLSEAVEANDAHLAYHGLKEKQVMA